MKKYKVTLNWVTYVNSDNPDPVFLKELAKDEFDNLVANIYRANMKTEEIDPNSKEYKEDSVRHSAEVIANMFKRSGMSEPNIIIDITGEYHKHKR